MLLLRSTHWRQQMKALLTVLIKNICAPEKAVQSNESKRPIFTVRDGLRMHLVRPAAVHRSLEILYK